MAARRCFWLVLLLVVVTAASLLGCAEEGPPGQTGPSGSPGQAGEVITVTAPAPPPAPLPPEVGLTPSQAQPRVSFDAADLPSGVKPGEVIASSPARVRVAFKLTNGNGEPIGRTGLDPMRFTIAHLEVDPVTGLSRWLNYIFRTQQSPITGVEVTQPNDETYGTY